MIDNTQELSARIYMTLNDVATKPRYRCNRALEVYRRAWLQASQRRPIKSFARHIGRKRIAPDIKRSQTHAINRDRVTMFSVFNNRMRFNRNVGVFATRLDAVHAS